MTRMIEEKLVEDKTVIQKRQAESKALVYGFVVVLLLASLLLMAKPAHAKTFTVDHIGDNNDLDPGDGVCEAATSQAQKCTLRAALREAGVLSGVDTIVFNIPDSLDPGVKTIRPNSVLPNPASVTIDGYTQPGASPNTLAVGTNAKLMIELDGSGAGSATGLPFGNSDNTVRGLVINRFGGDGISIGNGTLELEGNFIGTDPSGTSDLGNGDDGVSIGGPGGSTVGGTSLAARNLISGNDGDGVTVGSTGNEVRGNIVSSNGGSGVLVPFGTGNRILSNSIFSNAGLGIDLNDDGLTANDSGDGDAGANNRQNFPVLTQAFDFIDTTLIQGSLNSTPNATFTVQFFRNPSGTDEGKTFIGQTSVTTSANGNASVSFAPPAGQQVPSGERITATANSSSGDTSEFSKPVTVNNRAPAANDDSYQLNEDGTLSVPDGSTDVLGNDTDPDGDLLEAVKVSDPANGALTLNGNGSFFYDPDANFFGTDSFTYKATDGTRDSNTATVSITVNQINDAPSFSKGPDQAVSEDSGAHTVTSWATGISRGPANEDDQNLSFVVSNDNNALFSAQPAVASDGTLTFTPAPNQNGTASVSVRIKDDGGTANGGVDTSAPQSFTIFVTSVNDAPVASDDSYELNEDATLSVPDGSTDVLGNDVDVEGDPLTAVEATDPTHGTVALDANGSFSYEPEANFFGTDSFAYKASDGQASGNTARVRITVRPVNDAPTITPTSPKPNSKIKDSTPTVKARVNDLETNLSKSDIKLFVDDKRKGTFSYDRATDLLSFQSKELAPGKHTVKVVATDAQGRSATKQWVFRVVR